MEAVVWSDYLCPWCYLGQDRSALLETLGVTVSPRPYELHPEIPAAGLPLKESRGRRLYDRLAVECEAVGLPFARPAVLPNTRRALETLAWASARSPEVVPALHAALFRAVFVEGRPVHEPDALDEVVRGCGGDAGAARLEVDAGRFREAVDRSKEEATERGATGVPSWLIADRLLVTGVQPPEFFERVVARLQARS